jgi:acylphosphatase
MLKQTHCYIHGDVIGIGFRAWTKIQAKILSLNGWVKNVYDRDDRFGKSGGVEVVLQGEGEQIEKMIQLLKSGPPISHVTHLDYFWQDPAEIFESFDIKK